MNLRDLVGHVVIRTAPVVECTIGAHLLGGYSSGNLKDFKYCDMTSCVRVKRVINNVVIVEKMSLFTQGKFQSISCKYDDDNWKCVDEAWEYLCEQFKNQKNEQKENTESTKKVKNFRYDTIKERYFTPEMLQEHDFKLKEVIYVPVEGNEVAFRVEHVTKEKAYLVAVDCIGDSNMLNMNKCLDDFMGKIPKNFLDVCGEIEHKINGNILRKSKVTLLSHGNVTGDKICNGADDIQFDGMRTDAERCKNNTHGEACRYYEDTPFDSYINLDEVSCSETDFFNLYGNGIPNARTNSLYMLGICPCIAILRK